MAPGAFQVFIEGPVDRSPAGYERLAEAMNRRFGLPLAGLVPRLRKGRFRVKAGVDQPTAQAYARALERIGAQVAVEEAGARPSAPALAAPAAEPLLELASDAGPGTFEAPMEAPGTLELAADMPALDLAPDELEHQARKRAGTPLPLPPDAPAPAAPVPLEIAPPAAAPADAAPAAPAPLHRARFAAGVVLAVVLGFVPAHFVAAARERAAFREIDEVVLRAQSQTAEPLDDAALDQLRAEQQQRKQSERRSIALASLAIWAAIGGGLAYVWFRRVPWDRLAR